MHLVFSFIPKVYSEVEIEAVCRPLDLIHTKLGKNMSLICAQSMCIYFSGITQRDQPDKGAICEGQ